MPSQSFSNFGLSALHHVRSITPGSWIHDVFLKHEGFESGRVKSNLSELAQPEMPFSIHCSN